MTGVVRITGYLVVWAACILGAVSIRNIPLETKHDICGPWGCGPPTQALIACHVAWLVVLTPPVTWFAFKGKASRSLIRSVGTFLILASSLVLLAIFLDQWIGWWHQVDPWKRQYLWQRYGFWIATAVDLPIIQVLLGGVFLRFVGCSSKVSGIYREPEPASS